VLPGNGAGTMAKRPTSRVVGQLREFLVAGGGLSDGQLLEHFVRAGRGRWSSASAGACCGTATNGAVPGW
jgi:hypothetical protein